MINTHIMVATLLATLVVAGCSDNPDASAIQVPAIDPLASVPATAQADEAGLIDYLQVLAANASEVREPTDLRTVMLTSREDIEPRVLK